MNKVQDLGFDGSDNEAYEEDEDDDGEVENMLRTGEMDLSSDEEPELQSDDEEEKDRNFFGDDEYPTLREAQETMSMTMIQRDHSEKD